MPRPNRSRSVLAEEHLAYRIALEREGRGWTTDGLAKRMTDAGCSMTGSAIYKIEKGEPRRRIVVDELVAFAQVFNIPIEELLLPPEAVIDRQLTSRLLDLNQAAMEVEASRTKVQAISEDLRRFVASQLGEPWSAHPRSWEQPAAREYTAWLEEFLAARGEALSIDEQRLRRALRLTDHDSEGDEAKADGEHPEAE